MMATEVMANHYKFKILNAKKWWYCKFNTNECPMVATNETDIRQHVLDSHYINGLPPIDNNSGHQSSAATGSDTNGTDNDFIDDEDYYDCDEDWKQPSDDSSDSSAVEFVSAADSGHQWLTSDGSDDDNEDNNTGSDTQNVSQDLASNQDINGDNDSHQYSEDNTIESQSSSGRKTVIKSPGKTAPKSDGQRRRRRATVGKYKCREPGCPKSYGALTRLKKHECGHKCGFLIVPGDELDGLCGNANLNQYMDEVVKRGVQLYACLYGDCQFETNKLWTLKEHVHYLHVCPDYHKHNGIAGTAPARPRTGRLPISIPPILRKTGTTATVIKTSGNSSHNLLNTSTRNVISGGTSSGQQQSTVFNRTPPDVKYRPSSNRKSGSNIVINDRISLQTPSDAKVSFKISYKTGGQPDANTTTTTTVTTTSRPQPSVAKSPKTPIKLTPNGHLASISSKTKTKFNQKVKFNANPGQQLNDTDDSDVTDDDMKWKVTKRRPKRPRLSSAATNSQNIADTDQQSDLKCTHEDCDRQFTTKNKLDQHMADHRCGYGIDPDINNVCNHTNLKQYEQPYSDDWTGDSKFRCGYDYPNCVYWAFNASVLRDHIHRTHVCPNRVLKYNRSYMTTDIRCIGGQQPPAVIDSQRPVDEVIDKVVETDASNSQPSLAISRQRQSAVTTNNELPIADDNDSQSMTVSTNGQTLTKTSIDSHSSDVDSDDEDSTNGSYDSSSDEDFDDWISREYPDLEVIDSPSEAEPENDIQDIASNGSNVDQPSNPSPQELNENLGSNWLDVRDQLAQTSAVMAANCGRIVYLDGSGSDDDDLGQPQAIYKCPEDGCDKSYITSNALYVHKLKHLATTTTCTVTTNDSVQQLIRRERDVLRLSDLSVDALQTADKELDRLLIMRPYFRIDRWADGIYRYQCELCTFGPPSMADVLRHLKFKHFIPGLA